MHDDYVHAYQATRRNRVEAYDCEQQKNGKTFYLCDIHVICLVGRFLPVGYPLIAHYQWPL